MAVNGSNYFTVTVQSSQVDADLTDQPVYVNLGNLATSHGFWSNVKTDGADIRVTKDGDTKTEVPFELVAIDTGGETGELHFKASGTLSSTSNTEFRVYYNSTDTAYAASATFGSQNVWNSDYVGKYNLGESLAANAKDSTSNANDGNWQGDLPRQVSGQMGDAQDLDGTGDYISIPNSGGGDFDPGFGQFSILSWFKKTVTDNDNIIRAQTGHNSLFLIRADTDVNAQVRDENGTIPSLTGGTSVNDGNWHHVALTFDVTGGTMRLYVDGTLVDSNLSTGWASEVDIDGNVGIGHNPISNTGTLWEGQLDNTSFLRAELTSDRISTEYNNQNSSSTFYALSAEQSVLGTNDVVLTSDVANLFSHNVYFEIDIQDSASATYDIDLIDMGKLKYSFDIPNSGEDVTAVGIKSGAIDVQFDNYIDGTDTLIDLLDSSFAYDSNQTWLGKMFFKLKSAGSYGNPILFEFTPKEVEFDEVSQICSISFIPRQRVGLTAVDVCDEAESEVYTYTIDRTALIDPAANDNIAYVARDYIRHALYQGYAETTTYPISGVTIEIDSGIFTSTGTALRVTGEEWFVTYQSVISGTPTTIPYTDDALVLLGTLASLEGAIYGTALGNLFYIARSDLDNSVTLDTDNIVKLKQDFFVEAEYRQLNLTQVDYADEDINVIAFSKNTFAEKNINIRLDPPLLIKGDITTSGQADQIADDNTILLEAVSNYQPAFSFDNEKKVSLTYWGIDGIYPYSVINFDTNAPEFVKNRDFRIKNIEYDFKADKFEAEMYEI